MNVQCGRCKNYTWRYLYTFNLSSSAPRCLWMVLFYLPNYQNTGECSTLSILIRFCVNLILTVKIFTTRQCCSNVFSETELTLKRGMIVRRWGNRQSVPSCYNSRLQQWATESRIVPDSPRTRTELPHAYTPHPITLFISRDSKQWRGHSRHITAAKCQTNKQTQSPQCLLRCSGMVRGCRVRPSMACWYVQNLLPGQR